MASLLRQIVAGPRARHPEAGLDLCYVTDNIIATSGPSGTFPQKAYRNPLDELVKFLDKKHKDDWAIWEFRAEGTGYPDSEVYNRIWHFPWPDHHPPPFHLIPNIMASMRNWRNEKESRVIVVHCKAGKGRSGTASCSYLISEEGWKSEDALKRFTERRMRPGFGNGLSIPSQLRWITYVDRWTKQGKIYVERQVEVTELHVWGLRNGVKISIEGFVDQGKTIKTFYTFTRKECEMVRGHIKESGAMADVVGEMLAAKNASKQAKVEGIQTPSGPLESTPKDTSLDEQTGNDDDPGQGDAVYRPSSRVVLPTNDVNIDFERRNKATMGLTMVTSVAHVWFNTFFEGEGPERSGIPLDSGVFEIEWDALDGIKGSSRKGVKAFDKIGVVWKALAEEGAQKPIVIIEPKEGEPVKQAQPADWTGPSDEDPEKPKDLGLRVSSPHSSDVSRASSVRSTQSKKPSPLGHEDALASVQSHIPDDHQDTGVATHAQESETGLRSKRNVIQESGDSANSRDKPVDSSDDTIDPRGLTQSPEPAAPGQAGGLSTVHIENDMSHLSTADLPGGRPESEMEGHHNHMIGSIKASKNSHPSS